VTYGHLATGCPLCDPAAPAAASLCLAHRADIDPLAVAVPAAGAAGDRP